MDVGVCGSRIVGRQNTYRKPSVLCRTTAGRFHHAAKPATDKPRPALCDGTANVFCEGSRRLIARPGSTNPDDRWLLRILSLSQ
jgi:hypothetical protein